MEAAHQLAECAEEEEQDAASTPELVSAFARGL